MPSVFSQPVGRGFRGSGESRSIQRIREELSIPVSSAIAGVGQILTKPIVPVKEVVECFNMCKAAMERRGLKVNNGKMKTRV